MASFFQDYPQISQIAQIWAVDGYGFSSCAAPHLSRFCFMTHKAHADRGASNDRDAKELDQPSA
ncbi:hypothetical protein SAJA_11505 [Salinisphaera japonica YTM-1]|uniref:Uncharacterized protein n=1 Tax=Salinisphaera japonica YTM-1 TaxID=1209778 RepID=A0A423PKN2_9GAMM|nr:hypothetical protein SAJA_11505 [Salinisphaera japonica YTM-1]